MTLKKYLRLLRTLRYLKWQQLWYQVKYRYFQLLPEPPSAYTELALLPKRRDSNRVDTRRCDDQFSFLNQTHAFGSIEQINWNYSAFGKLWTYNLNYFDFIRQNPPGHCGKKTSGIAQLLIEDWITKSPIIKDGHEPYPTSLRIMNWLGFYEENNILPPDWVVAAVRIKYLDLWGKLEYHLQGNHLLENAIALVRAAYYFNDHQRLPKALRLLRTQLQEQYRPEGAHYELSGAYHCTLLGRLLELYAALQRQSSAVATIDTNLATSLGILQVSLAKQLGWLEYLTDNTGYYPHFNDSVDGIAPTPAYLFQLGQKLGLQPTAVPPNYLPAHFHTSFGVFDFWVDLGPIGPDYIPGHGHADNLTFCLNYQGQPIVVDPAISTYEKNERRQLERSTQLHNTVSWDEQNSSEVWGGFRCGRRATTNVLEHSAEKIVAEHDGYHHLGIKYRRAFSWSGASLDIQDKIKRTATTHLFFAPEFKVQKIADGQWKIGPIQLSISDGQTTVQDYQFARGFNQLAAAKSLHITFTNELNLRFTALG